MSGRARGRPAVVLFTLAAVLLALTGACTRPATATAHAARPSSRLRVGTQTLSRCEASPLAYCGTLSVPLDYATPTGPHIAIAYRWYPASAPPGGRAAGTVVPVEGGPGYPSIGSVSYRSGGSPAVLSQSSTSWSKYRACNSMILGGRSCQPGSQWEAWKTKTRHLRSGMTRTVVVFVELPNTKIELLHPLGANSPIAKFLERNPDGGMHHLCYEVEDIIAARDQLKAKGARVLGDGNPKIGAHGKPVLFLHPKDFSGALIEIEQV